jgi:hypothetical protein
MYYCSTFCLAGRAQLSHNVDPLGRAALPTIDLASRARWSRRRVLQGCLRCTSTSCCCVTRRALMLDNVDPLRRARSVDHRCLRPCTVASPSCTPRLPTMYQYSLLSSGETSADVGQCRLVLMRGAVSTRDLAAHARWHRRRVRHGCLRCNSVRCCCLVERAQMMVNADSSRRVTQCRPSTSPSVCAGSAERLKCMIAHMVALNETIHSLPRCRFPSDADSPPPNVRQMQRVPVLKTIAQATFKRH